MVFFVNEEKARKIFKLVGKNNVSVFTYVESHKAPADRKVKMDYLYAGYAVPQRDVISAVVSGAKTIKEVVSSMTRNLRKPDPRELNEGEINTIVSLAMAADMASSQKSGKAQVVIFLKEDPNGDTASNTAVANKLVKKWLESAFNEFGMSVLTDIKEFKESLNDYIKDNKKKGKTGKKKKKMKKQLTRTFIADADAGDIAVHIGQNGTSPAYIDALAQLYHPEFSLSSIYQDKNAAPNFKAIGQKKAKSIINNLFAIMTGNDEGRYKALISDQIPTPSSNNEKKDKKMNKNAEKARKQIKKIKKLARKNAKPLAKGYKNFANIMKLTKDAVDTQAVKNNTIAPKVKTIPKVKFDGKKSAKSVKKASKFFQKRKNAYLLAALIGHLSSIRMGNDFGTKKYTRTVAELLAEKDSSIAKGFETAVNALNAEIKKASKTGN